jgi:hypothetical protein
MHQTIHIDYPVRTRVSISFTGNDQLPGTYSTATRRLENGAAPAAGFEPAMSIRGRVNPFNVWVSLDSSGVE